MKILVGSKFRSNFLDYYRGPEDYRIRVCAWINLEREEGLYFVRPAKISLLWNYLREIGLTAVRRKVFSRRQERFRNEKYISCGLGKVLEAPQNGLFEPGQVVAFLAPSHPACAERIVLPAELICQAERFGDLLNEKFILFGRLTVGEQRQRWWSSFKGWSRYAGWPVSGEKADGVMRNVLQTLEAVDWQKARKLAVDSKGEVELLRRRRDVNFAANRKRAVLFGYGNYAKTNIVPNVSPYITISCIHEIDPTQIPAAGNFAESWCTSPQLRDKEQYDVLLIAGFHHTHTPLAIEALNNGAYAVVEKPIVVDRSQLNELLDAMRNSTGQLFCCFHKRYLPFNKLAINDMSLREGEPVSYHCIVYEVPLPEFHWYRWPNSRSRLVSNGCHWLDHFLYLNGFSRVSSYDLTVAFDGTINCSVTLANGAFFTMVLTDRGSERIGVRDYVELHTDDVTVKMIDGSDYVAESRNKIIRKTAINKMHSYKVMYQQIGQKIAQGLQGDSIQSVEVSAGLVLALEDKLSQLASGQNGRNSRVLTDLKLIKQNTAFV